MSFVTKRERVFNEYKLYDLPARNEGKLKAYASCTDARAWSHFIADKTEHLQEIIKRNNEKCRPKYVPTEVIVDTLMMAKNSQISRLKRKIQQFERLLAAYDHLDLSAEQKSEMAKAHATIKAANKELGDLYIDLDVSGDAEGIDSEVFGTGKSRGDEICRSFVVDTAKSSISEWSYIKEPTPNKSRDDQSDCEQIDQNDQNIERNDQTKQVNHPNNIGGIHKFPRNRAICFDAGTDAREDYRIEELQDMIVTKDARLNAMQNTIAVLENDVCEPYCIYAHIYTALEKIFGILRQNLKYKQYLDLLTLGKDTRHVHIKGKILFKIKILEKFSVALIAPCSQTDKQQNCTCYRAEVLTGYDAYAESGTGNSQTIIDKKRAHLIADIIDLDEIQKALNDQRLYVDKTESDSMTEFFDIEEYTAEDKCRFLIKSLQLSYGELVTCYEKLKSEKDVLYMRCQELLKVEEQNEYLRNNMRNYSNLWNDMEYFRQRSESLDKLKAKYYLLLNETSYLESKFIAESEKNKIKSDTINELRNENLLLDKKFQELSLLHEKEINSLIFKMKEIECANMCKEQQIKSLSSDIENFFSQENVGNNYLRTHKLLDRKVNEQDQKNVEETCKCKNVAAKHLHLEINNNLEYMNELKLEAEIWEKKYRDAVNTIDSLNNEIRIINIRNQELNEKVDEKTKAICNLHNIVQNKSEQIETLHEELEKQESNKVFFVGNHESKQSLESGLPLIQQNELNIINSYDKNNKPHTTVEYKNKRNDSLFKKELSRLDQSQNFSPQSIKNTPDYSSDIEKNKKVIDVPERESVVVDQYLHDVNNHIKNTQYILQNGSQEIDNSRENSLKYIEESIEISKIQNDLKKMVSLIEKEQQFFIEQNSAKTDPDFEFSLHTTQDVENNQSNSKGQLLSQQGTALNTNCDEVKEQYTITLSQPRKVISKLQTKIVNLKDRGYDDVSYNNLVQDICLENKNLSEELKQKNYEIKKLWTDINKLRNSFQEKLAILEKEKHTFFDDLNNSPNSTGFMLKFIENNDLTSNEQQSSNLNEYQSDVLSQFKLLCEESLITINKYENLKEMYKNSLEVIKNDGKHLKSQDEQINKESKRSEELMDKYNKLLREKNIIQNELYDKTGELNNFKNNCQQMHLLVQELEPFKLKYELLNTEIKNKLTNKESEINELKKTNALFEREIKNCTSTIEDLKQNEESLQHICNTLKMDKEKIKSELEEKINELKNIKNQLEKTTKENNTLLSKISNLEVENNYTKNKIYLLQNDILSMQSRLDSLNKEVTEKDRELVDLKNNSEKFTNILIYNDEIKKENNRLLHDLKICEDNLKTSEDKNKVVTMLNHNILSEMESMKTLLKIKEDEIIKSDSSFKDMKQEIEKIKSEKSCDEDRLLDLLNKLQSSEQIINKLNEDLLERSNTVFELQNHINNLQEEIKKLHVSLDVAVEHTNKVSQEDIEEIDQLAEKVKAHYSKAKHNIKPEIAKLQDKNERLDLLKLGSKERNIETENYVSKINSLENERETVLHNLNQLEIAVLGLSKLTNKSCTKDIIDVLHNIQKTYEEKRINYVKKIQDAQSSYQLLKIKAEKAKEMAENDKQTLINEKENKEQLLFNTETKLKELYKQSHCKDIEFEDIIKNLEIKLLSQQSLFEELNETKEIRIKDLDNEITNLLEMYQKSLRDIDELREKLETSKDHNNLLISLMDKLRIENLNKCNEIKYLQEMIQNVKDKVSSTDIETQISFQINSVNQNTQTNDSLTNTVSSSSINRLPPVNSNVFLKENSSVGMKEIVEKSLKPSVDKITRKLERLRIVTLEEFSICTLLCNSINDESLISSTTVTDLYDNKIKKDIIVNNSCNDKKVQTEDDYFKFKIETNNAMKPSTTPKTQIKLSDDNFSLTYKQEIKNLPKKLYSQTDFIAKGMMIENSSSNNHEAYKKTIEPLDSAENNITIERYLKLSNKNSNNISERPLSSKIQSLDDLKKVGNFQKPEDAANKSDINLESPDFSIPESIIITNFSDQISNKCGNINNSPKTTLRKTRSYELNLRPYRDIKKNRSNIVLSSSIIRPITLSNITLEKLNSLEKYKKEIENLSNALQASETEHHKKIEAIKQQYGNHIKSIINEHNKGVVSIQTLHEETLSDVIKIHDIEIENLRALSIEAMTKSERLEKENKKLRLKMELKEFKQRSALLSEKPKRKSKFHTSPSYLTKTDVEAFNVKPKRKLPISCACAVNIDVSDVIRNIFEQVGMKTKNIAEQIYLKYIAEKLMDGIETLNPQELSFLHLKVCRKWKTIRNKDKALKSETESSGQKLAGSELHPVRTTHTSETEPQKTVQTRRLCRDNRKSCYKVPVKSGSTAHDPPHLDSKNIKHFCGCVYNVKKYKEGNHNGSAKKRIESGPKTEDKTENISA